MFTLFENGTIYVNRGDSFAMPLEMNVGTKMYPITYEMDQYSFVYFGIMEPNQAFENALVRKKYTYTDVNEDGNVLIKIRPQDTQCLLPGKYYYQIKLQVIDPDNPEVYDVQTIVDKTQLFIME